MDNEKRSEGASKSAPATELPTAPPTAPTTAPTSEPEPIPGRTRSNSYNPFEHRENLEEEPNGDIRSLANLIKGSLGTGILAMPLAFANAGWLVGFFGTIIIGFICTHCVHIFVQVSRGCCKSERKPLLGYADTCRYSFLHGPESLKRYALAAYVFAEVALMVAYTGTCCIYTVLIADSIKQIFDHHLFTTHYELKIYCFALIIPLCLMVQVKQLKWLALFSIAANILMFCSFAICLYYIFGEPIVLSDKKMAGDLDRFPVYLCTVIFAMEGIGVVMPVENTMKHPEHFLGYRSVLTVAMTVIVVLYVTLGLFGYLRYGDVLRGSITLNLPINDWPAVAAKLFVALSIFFTYPLHFYILVDTLFRFKRYMFGIIPPPYRQIAQIVLRLSLVVMCGAISIAIPYLEQIINIVGALFYSILGLIIPGIVDTVFRWNDLGRYQWVLHKNIFMISFGLFSMVFGCRVAIIDILNAVD